MKLVQLVLAFVITSAPSLFAGEWHFGDSNRCGDCHLQHSSFDNMPLPGGPYSYLLKKNTINELCLSCHDGGDATAPDVVAPVDMYSASTSGESAAGYFGQTAVINSSGHVLGVPMTTPLQGASSSTELNCASCHAVHGNDNYRNLLNDPAVKGDSFQIVVGVDIFTNHSPDNPPSVPGTIAAYERGNVRYANSISAWCSSCHDLLEANTPSSAPAHFNGHPTNVALSAYVSDRHTDPAHWVSGSGEGFTGTGGITRVPFESPGATSFSTASTPLEANQVSCLSCHKAHGSANKKAMIWPFVEGGDNFIAGCQQCHNK